MDKRGHDKRGTNVALTVGEMEQSYNRRRDHMIGRRESTKWAIRQLRDAGPCNLAAASCPPAPPAAAACPPAIFFWQSVAGREITENRLPNTFVRGLESFTHNANMNSVLWTYGSVEAPAGCRVMPAETLLPLATCMEALRHGVHVALLSDYIRYRAALRLGGWVVDGDSIWLRQCPRMDLSDPASLGHFFSSMEKHTSNNGLTRTEGERRWRKNYLVSPGDRRVVASTSMANVIPADFLMYF